MSVNSGPCWERVRYCVSPSSQWFQSEQNGSVLAHSQIIGKHSSIWNHQNIELTTQNIANKTYIYFINI